MARRSRLPRATIVGIVNVTPDSFSDGGNFLSAHDAARRAEQLLSDGADVIEIGGESTRPGAIPVSADVELERVIPVIAELHHRHPYVRIAIDTTKAEVARSTITAGASVVNDVSALRLDPAVAAVCAQTGSTLVLMHSRGSVADMARYAHAQYDEDDPIDAVVSELRHAAERATASGVPPSDIVLDPGLGFAKRSIHSMRALAHIPRLTELGFPVMVGASRKRFIGEITGVNTASERDAGSIGANVVALTLGATWFRVHDVRGNRHALDVAAAILEERA